MAMHPYHLPRRAFVTTLMGAGLAASHALMPGCIAGRAFAAPQAGSRLLVVFLRGAYDATHVIVPTGSDFYYQARPHIALARPDPADPKAALPLDADWGLHPVLKDSILPLWQQKQIAFIPFAGTDDLSRSHFETQDTVELGQPLKGHRDYGSGFMARLATLLGPGGRPMAFTEQLPLCFHGAGQPIPNLAPSRIGHPIDPRQARLIEDMYKGHPDLAPTVTQGFAVREDVFHKLDAEMKDANRGAVSTRGFEAAARRIGTLMRDGYNLAFVDVGGWDTHVHQGQATGYLADRTGELGRALAGFAQSIGPQAWRDTTVVVISEFGRTFRENGDGGTDHGHGSIYWVLGGGVSGGRMAGEQVALTAASLNQNRDLPVLTDYRALIGGIAARQFGLSAAQMAHIFPAIQPTELHLL